MSFTEGFDEAYDKASKELGQIVGGCSPWVIALVVLAILLALGVGAGYLVYLNS